MSASKLVRAIENLIDAKRDLAICPGAYADAKAEAARKQLRMVLKESLGQPVEQ